MKLRIVLLLIALCLMLPSISNAQTFQKRTAVEKDKVATFAVRNPTGKTQYKAVFVVTAPDRKQYNREKDGRDDEWAEVVFPDDFKVQDEVPGKYQWKCIINRKVVASDHFNIK